MASYNPVDIKLTTQLHSRVTSLLNLLRLYQQPAKNTTWIQWNIQHGYNGIFNTTSLLLSCRHYRVLFLQLAWHFNKLIMCLTYKKTLQLCDTSCIGYFRSISYRTFPSTEIFIQFVHLVELLIQNIWIMSFFLLAMPFQLQLVCNDGLWYEDGRYSIHYYSCKINKTNLLDKLGKLYN